MKRIWMLLLVLWIVPRGTTAQSQFGNQMIYAGTTCPPTLTPGGTNGGAGSLYTCTGTGALYNWTGAAWSLVTGSGGGGIGGTIAVTQIAVGTGVDAVGGSADFTQNSVGNVRLFSDDATTQGYLLDVDSTSTSSADPAAFYPRMLHSIFNMNGTGNIVNKRVIPLDGEVFNNSTGNITWSSSAELYAENISTGTWGTMIGAAARLFNDDTATVDEMVGFQTSPASHFANGNYGGGTVTSYTAFEGNSVNDNGTYGAVYGLHLISQVGLTVTGNNHAINYNDTFVIDSLGQNIDGINASAVPDVDSSLYGAPALAGAGAGNVSNGTHRYKFIYGNLANTIHTADSGAPTAAVTVVNNAANGQVTVSIPGQCDLYFYTFIYRDKDSDGVYKLVGDNSAFFGCLKTFTDNVADGSLGATIPTTNNTLAPILSVSGGNILIPSRADSFGNQDLYFTSVSTGGDGPYIAFHPEDRLTTAIPKKGMIFWGNWNAVPASLDRSEGGQIGAQGGQDAAGGYGFVYGGAVYSSVNFNFQGGAYFLANGGTAAAGGSFSLNSGSSFATVGNINGGNGEIVGGAFANSGHYGDLTVNQWRNVTLTATGPLTINADIVMGTGKAIETDTTTAHTMLFRAYDVDAAIYQTFMTFTNGNTPSLSIGQPSGASTTFTGTTFTATNGTAIQYFNTNGLQAGASDPIYVAHGGNHLQVTANDGLNLLSDQGSEVLVWRNVELFADDGASHAGVVVLVSGGAPDGTGAWTPSRDQDDFISLGLVDHEWNNMYIVGGLGPGTANAHTLAFRARDVDGNTYSTFATLTNGNTPDFTITPPTGGTVNVTANLYTGAGSGLTVANVGANSCGTTAATVAGGSNSFEVTVGATSGTQCRVAFPTAAPNRWNCAPSNNVTGNLVRAVAVDTTHVDLIGIFAAADVINTICVPR